MDCILKVVYFGLALFWLFRADSGVCQSGANISNPKLAMAAPPRENTPETPTPKRKVAVGDKLYGLAFDGENIWAANHENSTVAKIRVSDGSLIGTFPVARGSYGVAFDGRSVWVTSNVENTVTKLQVSDGRKLGTFSVGKGPHLSSDSRRTLSPVVMLIAMLRLWTVLWRTL